MIDFIDSTVPVNYSELVVTAEMSVGWRDNIIICRT